MYYLNEYEVLGFDYVASTTEVKKRYKELAKKYHPDLNSDANASSLFIVINDAYNKIIANSASISFAPKPRPAPKPKKKHSTNATIYRILSKKDFIKDYNGNRGAFKITFPDKVIPKNTRIFFMLDVFEFSILIEDDYELPCTLSVRPFTDSREIYVRIIEGF